MNKRMLVIGCYGCGNRGDDAILQGICALFPEYEISAFNGKYQDVSKLFGIKRVPCRLNEGFSVSVLLSLIRQFPGIIRAVLRSDVVLYGGGSLIHDLTKYNLPFHFMWSKLAGIMGKRVYYFSMGVGPVRTRRGMRLCRSEFEKCNGVFVRDKRGLAICRKLGLSKVMLTADAAFAVEQKSVCGGVVLRELDLEQGSYVAVTGCQWFQSENFWNRANMDFSDDIRDFADVLMEVDGSLRKTMVFVPTEKEDYQLGVQLKTLLKSIDFKVAPIEWDTKKISAVIENSYILIGMRMHSIIMAARQRIPFVALIYDGKVRELLKMMGMEQYGIDIEDMKKSDVVDLVKDIESEYGEIQCELGEVAAEFREKVYSSAKLVKVGKSL